MLVFSRGLFLGKRRADASFRLTTGKVRAMDLLCQDCTFLGRFPFPFGGLSRICSELWREKGFTQLVGLGVNV